VLRLIGRGLSNAEIGRELNISDATVTTAVRQEAVRVSRRSLRALSSFPRTSSTGAATTRSLSRAGGWPVSYEHMFPPNLRLRERGATLPPKPLRTALSKLKLIDEDGAGPDHDQWDGYPAERARVTGHLVERAIDDVVFLSADIHVSVAAEVADEVTGRPVGVEIAAPSLTSQNLDDKLGVDASDPRIRSAEAAYTAAHPHVQWCDMAAHGYVVIDVDSERLRGEWWHVDTVLWPSRAASRAVTYEVRRGDPRLRRAL
jgi:PhoD-like phosphatase